MKVNHRELMDHLPHGWTVPSNDLSRAECEKLMGMILEGENFAERVNVFIEILTKFGVRIT